MKMYIITYPVFAEAFRDPTGFKKLAEATSARIKTECPGPRWKESFSTLGRFDIVDLIEAEDVTQTDKAAMIIRSSGHSITETMVAAPWKEFQAAL